jgi:plastocyanin
VIVSVGDTVTFRNADKMPGGHSVVADNGSFESPALDEGERWSYEFPKLGMFPYHVGEHPDVKGKVIVE